MTILKSLIGGSLNSTKQVVQTQKLIDNIILRSIKLIDIFYITFIYGIPSIIVVAFLDKYIYNNINFDKSIPDDKKSSKLIFIELLICLSINGVCAYILRNILQLIPFPLNGFYGFNHMSVVEVKNGAMIAMIMLWFSTGIHSKVTAFQHNLGNYI